jgi:hypothetical protein
LQRGADEKLGSWHSKRDWIRNLGKASSEDFEIAIICTLPIKLAAVSLLFNEFWDEDGAGDPNTYMTGRIGKHNVVLASLIGVGKISAAATAASFRARYASLWLALLVGIYGGVPRADHDEILLGDVVISRTIVPYSFGKKFPDKFMCKDTIKDNLGKPNKDINNLLATFQTKLDLEWLKQRTATFLKQL